MTEAEERKELWLSAYRDLIRVIESLGYPAEFAKALSRDLNSVWTMRRMVSYLEQARPDTPEEIADEMLAIKSDQDEWIRKKEAEGASIRYNEIMRYGLGVGDDEAGDEGVK